MPTWLTGALVSARIARSASEGAAEDPHVAGAGEFDRLVQCELGHTG